jgi:hypothetical protein
LTDILLFFPVFISKVVILLCSSPTEKIKFSLFKAKENIEFEREIFLNNSNLSFFAKKCIPIYLSFVTEIKKFESKEKPIL